MNLIVTKIIVMIGLGLGSLLAGLLPVWLSVRGRQQWPMLTSFLLCFGSGVLMSTSLIHMLPEVREALSSNNQYAELIFCSGFFILYIIDEIVHLCYNSHLDSATPNHPHTHRIHNSYGAIEHEPLLQSETSQRQPPFNPTFSKSLNESNLCEDNNISPSQLCHVVHQEPCHSSPVGNLGLLIALTIHAILEGLAVGLESSSKQVLLLFGAIASHKYVVGFCLGVELVSTNTACCHQFLAIALFSFGSAGGIGIGMLVSVIPEQASQIIFPLLQGLAGGTLLYVTVSEVLPRERARWHQQHERKFAGIIQFVAVILGFGLMAVMIKYLDADK